MMRKAKQKGWLLDVEAAKRRGEWLKISHLLYIGDTLAFCDSKVEQLRHYVSFCLFLKLYPVSM